MGPLPRESKVNQKIQKCLTEVYGHTFTSCHYEALFARLEKSQGLIKKSVKRIGTRAMWCLLPTPINSTGLVKTATDV